MMPDWRRRWHRESIEQRYAESLHVCNAFGIFNLPCKQSSCIDVSSTGDKLLCSDKSCFCIINVQSQLFEERCLRRPDEQCTPCSCATNTNTRSSPAPCDTLTSKPFIYKSKCAATLWYPVEDRIFLSAGDSLVHVWDLNIPDISHAFNVKLSSVRKLAVQSGASLNSFVAAGLSCGSISACDMRAGVVLNYTSSIVGGEVTALSFQTHDENLLAAGHEDGSVVIWDLRRYNKPLTLLSDKGHVTGIINGCNVSYVDGARMSAAQELPVSHNQDFADEEDIWSYVMGHDNHKTTPATDALSGSLSPSGKGKSTSKRVRAADTANERSLASISTNNLSSKNAPDDGSIGPRSKYSGRRPSQISTVNKLMAKYRLNGGTRLYSGPQSVIREAENKVPPRKAPAGRSLSRTDKGVLKDRGIPSAVECTRDGHYLFIARHRGFIEQYDARNYHYVGHFVIDPLIKSKNPAVDDAYQQYMRMICFNGGDHILFNVRDQLAVLDVKRSAICDMFPLEWEDHETLVDLQHTHPHRSVGLKSKYATDFTAVPNRREFYVINEMGELFVIHPDKRIAFSQPNPDVNDASDCILE